MKRITTFSLLIIFLAGCSSSMQNLSLSKKEVKIYYESGAYTKELRKIVDEAEKDIRNIDVSDSSAVIFDIDETALSNYDHIKSINFGYDANLWDKWILEAKAPAITEVRQLYDRISVRGIRVIFLTGRNENEYEATYKNLVDAGYAKFDTLIVRSSSMDGSTAANYKRIERTVLTAAGYKIIACIGDQESDFIGENTGIKIKLPNYLYVIE